MADKLKLSLAGLVLVSGLFAFYAYEDQALLIRVVTILAAVAIAGGIATFTAPGQTAREFIKGATIEIRKVVWPTRKETVQTTLMVLVMVILVGIMLWLMDMFLMWAVQILTGQGA
ncbi:MAG: preprotein translocase subunit SecE [Thiohalospira sp.]